MSNIDEEGLKLKQELATLLEEKEQRLRYNKLSSYFPDSGKYARKLYKKHIEFMTKGATCSQRAFIAANRTGKTVTGSYEMTLHLTGNYPDWWQGKRFVGAISAWAASISNEMTKNVLQEELLGSPVDPGSGMIPKELIQKVVKKPGVADAVETVYITHISGATSRLDFKSYEQGRATFQGTKKQVIWLDEEPTDKNIYTECLTRTAGKKGEEGIIFCTFTPLFGLSDIVLSFLPDSKVPIGGHDPDNKHRFVTQVEWDEVPHLSKEWKEEALKAYSVHERDARSKGVPSLGSGAIYPYSESEISVTPFQIPVWWPKAYALDVGWNRTAAIWGARDPASGIVYLYSEHYMGHEPPSVHASAIKARGDWIIGACDPAAEKAISQADGVAMLELYNQEGLDLVKADNTVEAGIWKIQQLLSSGQLKVFSTLQNFFSEYRVYRRDERGIVVKKNDHLMDAMRYLIMTGTSYMRTTPDPDDSYTDQIRRGVNDVTGY